MSDYVPTVSWPQLLGPAVNQRDTPLCWSVASTRALEAILKVNDMLVIDGRLSIQETIHVGLKMHYDDQREAKRTRSKFHPIFDKKNGNGLVRVERVLDGLMQFGTVLYEDGPTLTFHRKARRLTQDKPRYCIDGYRVHFLDYYIETFGQDLGILMFDSRVEDLIKICPVMGCLKICGTGEYDPLFNPTPEDLQDILHGHAIYIAAQGIRGGILPYFEYQDSYGENIGIGGIRRFAKGKGSLSYVVEMRVKHKRPRSPGLEEINEALAE